MAFATNPYDNSDDFVADGSTGPKPAVTLTITKLLTTHPGKAATGSRKDIQTSEPLGVGVSFTLQEVKPAGSAQPDTMKPGTPSTYELVKDAAGVPIVYKGVTNNVGQITCGSDAAYGIWKRTDSVGNPTTAVGAFPDGEHYYLLTETDSPYAAPGSTGQASYERSEPSIFDLPHRASYKDSNDKTVNGLVYKVSIFLKNVAADSKGDLTKRAVSINGNADAPQVVKVGDIITYAIEQKLYVDPTPIPADSKLDLAEIANLRASGDSTNPYFTFADQLPSVLSLSSGPSLELLWDQDGIPQSMLLTGPPARSGVSCGSTTSSGITSVSCSLSATDDVIDTLNHHPASSQVSNVRLRLQLSAQLTTASSNAASAQGRLVNEAHTNFRDLPSGSFLGQDFTAQSRLLSAGFQFVVTDLSGSTGLPGAKFRLTEPGNPDNYLCADGKFYKESEAAGAGIQIIEAVSNTDGVVTFVGLPLFDSGAPAVASAANNRLRFELVESHPPLVGSTQYEGPTVPFGMVDFSAFAGEKLSKLQVSKTINKSGLTQQGSFSFGRFAANIANPSPHKDTDGNSITLGVINWAPEKGEIQPVGTVNAIPLTGGRGVAIFLIAGLLLMVASYGMKHIHTPRMQQVRHRRSSK
ncbi:hypothetical protein KIMH_00760 [Bombiscardovia apis]|uniref:Prealbumin-like fold domain-containing protein n=1 Tax=Bombiscardovia apis TaxID=2932182 RepID=A0ABM8BBJ2_9BIFI|nr:hypothetical protein KIMH_00760 [Bombiscardovia apis]